MTHERFETRLPLTTDLRAALERIKVSGGKGVTIQASLTLVADDVIGNTRTAVHVPLRLTRWNIDELLRFCDQHHGADISLGVEMKEKEFRDALRKRRKEQSDRADA